MGCTNSLVSPLQHGDLADQRRRDEGELLLRRQEHSLDLARQVPAHVLASWNSNSKSETARRPRTTTDKTVLAREVHRETRIAHHLDVRQVGQHLAGEVDTLCPA